MKFYETKRHSQWVMADFSAKQTYFWLENKMKLTLQNSIKKPEHFMNNPSTSGTTI